MDRWRKPGDETRRQRDGRREEHHAAVDLQRQRDRYGNRERHHFDQAKEQRADCRSGAGADRSEHEAFRQQLADQAAAARADRQSDPDLALTAGRARQQHVGDVGACHEQDQCHAQHQGCGDRPEHRVRLRMDPDVRGDGHGPLLVRLRMRGRKLLHDDLQVRLRPLDRLAVREPALHEQPALAAALEPGVAGRRRHAVLNASRLDFLDPRQRQPHLRLQHRQHARERRRCDADDGVGLAVNEQRFAERRRIPSVVAHPRAVREDNGARRARAIVFGQQRASERGADAEQLEVVARDDLAQRHS